MSGGDGGTLIDRHDLMAALDGAAGRRVTVVSAPAGSGKTSLLRAWADRQDRVAFLSVKPGQHDAQLFWLALLGALRGTAAPSAAPAFDGPAMTERVRAELAAPGAPRILIIDDLHELTSPEAIEQLTALLTQLPEGVRAVVATRGERPLRLHRLRLAGDLAEIRAERLAFSPDETRRLLAVAGVELPGPLLATLHERTEGWAAGLRLAVLSLAGHPDPERFVAEFSGSDRTVAEYLMAEMLGRQPPEVRRMLLRTSVLDRVNGELADLLTGATGSERMLLGLEDANAFVVSLDPGRTWFRYHRLFGDLLRLELRRTAAADISGLHRLAARWLADHAGTADAIRHLQAAGDWPGAAGLLTDHALSLTLDGQAATVAALLRDFPPRIADDFPGLGLVRAIADLNELRLDQAAAHLDAARTDAATPRRRMTLASLDLLVARLRGSFEEVLAQVDVLPAAGPAQSPADVALAGDLRAVALLNLGVTHAWSLRLAESEKYLTEGAALARDLHRPYLEVACLAHLGFATTDRSLAEARRNCEEAIAQAARHGWESEPVIAPAQATLAAILIATGDLDHGERRLDRARHATRAGGEPGLQLLIHLVSAILAAARGHHRPALAELAEAHRVRAAMAGEHALGPRLTALTIATRARLGEVSEARDALSGLDPRLLATPEIRNAAATVSLAEGNPAAARHAPEGSTLTQVETHLLDALASHARADDRATRASLEPALHLAEPDRLILPFAITGAWDLLPALPSAETSHAALIADILDVRNGSRARPTPADPPPDRLSPSELRVLRYLPTNLTRPEIAGELSISVNTVNTHIRHIYTKLGATDRSTAVQRGRDLRLLSTARL
ncbi:LuxR C-terminal-related transcriptional regulator [Paractinoplanes globisporus]|uniref:LuxR C-terminal-related transcriptional regulator n=1 Tax=Paractinoplanes globisporus TaxID=113565 RepID=A0ABW6WPV6_9ACTN|nr:LuxR C-terminal-related transcriptional regulator [Actinoplanes globisporus]